MSAIPAAEQRLIDQKWIDLLPAPPQHGQDETAIRLWMRECAEVGGLPALEWLYTDRNFPLGPFMRGRVQHIFGELHRELQDRARHQVERAAAERRAKDDAAAHDLRRSKGWAP